MLLCAVVYLYASTVFPCVSAGCVFTRHYQHVCARWSDAFVWVCFPLSNLVCVCWPHWNSCVSSRHDLSSPDIATFSHPAYDIHLRDFHGTNPASLFLSLVWRLCSLGLDLSASSFIFLFFSILYMHTSMKANTHIPLFSEMHIQTQTYLLPLPLFCFSLKSTALPNTLLLFCAVPICFIWRINPEDLSTCQQACEEDRIVKVEA